MPRSHTLVPGVEYFLETGLLKVNIELVGYPLTLTFPRKDLDHVIGKIINLSDGTGLIQRFLDKLFEVQQLPPKSKGIQAGRRLTLINLKYAAAWTYNFVCEQWKHKQEDRYGLLQRAEAELGKLDKDWTKGKPREQKIKLTAFVVDKTHGAIRRKEGLMAPSDPNWDQENYYKRYVLPQKSRVEKMVTNKPSLLTPLPNYLIEIAHDEDPLEAWKIACKTGRLQNPILREVFRPWEKD